MIIKWQNISCRDNSGIQAPAMCEQGKMKSLDFGRADLDGQMENTGSQPGEEKAGQRHKSSLHLKKNTKNMKLDTL